jgi:hypothetical protein
MQKLEPNTTTNYLNSLSSLEHRRSIGRHLYALRVLGPLRLRSCLIPSQYSRSIKKDYGQRYGLRGICGWKYYWYV